MMNFLCSLLCLPSRRVVEAIIHSLPLHSITSSASGGGGLFGKVRDAFGGGR